MSPRGRLPIITHILRDSLTIINKGNISPLIICHHKLSHWIHGNHLRITFEYLFYIVSTVLVSNVLYIFECFSVDVSSEFKFESRKIWWKIVFREVNFQHILRTLESRRRRRRRLDKGNVITISHHCKTFKSSSQPLFI